MKTADKREKRKGFIIPTVFIILLETTKSLRYFLKNQGKKADSENFYNYNQREIKKVAGEREQQQGIIQTGDSHSALVKNLFTNCLRNKVKKEIKKNHLDYNKCNIKEVAGQGEQQQGIIYTGDLPNTGYNNICKYDLKIKIEKRNQKNLFYYNHKNIKEAAGEGGHTRGNFDTGDFPTAGNNNLHKNSLKIKAEKVIQKNLIEYNRMTMEVKELIMDYLEMKDVL